MSTTGSNPTDPTTNVREPHEHTDGLPPTKPTATDLKAAADPTDATPLDPQK